MKKRKINLPKVEIDCAFERKDICMLCHTVYTMTAISVRVPDEIKKKMKKLSHINWSEELREVILKIINKEENKNIAKALLANEELRKDAPSNWDSTELIRYWRDDRYGNSCD